MAVHELLGVLACLLACVGFAAGAQGQPIHVGWAQVDITPGRSAAVAGMPMLRITDKVTSPLTATALALEAPYEQGPDNRVVIVSCDLRGISEELLQAVRDELTANHPQVDGQAIIMGATHTHNAPPLSAMGIPTDAMVEEEYIAFAAPRLAAAISQAWSSRKPGGVSFGLSHAVVGHNRLMANTDGTSRMGGRLNRPDFSHVEGYEDAALNLLYTWDDQGQITGVLINAAVTAQTLQNESVIAADFWHETRQELRQRLGAKLYVLPQCSSAGDQMSRPWVYRPAEDRMEKLMGLDRRQMMAKRIADGVMAIHEVMSRNIETTPALRHRSESVPLPRRVISQQDVDEAAQGAAGMQEAYDKALADHKANPALMDDPKWVANATRFHRELRRAINVKDRYELQQKQSHLPVEMHVLRLGDMAMASNPFELYLDFGVQIKTRSPAVQTFVVELSNGSFGYIPTQRSVAGGAYGATPASTYIGPEGGKELVDWTVQTLQSLWQPR